VHDVVLILRRPVEARGDRVAEGEGVERERAARAERGCDAVEHQSLLLPAVQVEERAERDVDQRRRLVELEVAGVGQPQLERQPGRALACDLEHRRGGIDAEDGLAGGPDDLDRHPAAPDHELDDRPVRLTGERDVVGDVLGHVCGPCVVDRRPGVVFGHGG
jgi:hypothetical protein